MGHPVYAQNVICSTRRVIANRIHKPQASGWPPPEFGGAATGTFAPGAANPSAATGLRAGVKSAFLMRLLALRRTRGDDALMKLRRVMTI